MKKIILAVILLTSLQSAVSATGNENRVLWEQANTHYINSDYKGAAKTYEAILKEGYVSGRLYYNLGNAYFKDGQLGLSILNYNKALLLSPSDRDAEFNLSVANGYIKDNIAPMPEFIVSRWIHSFRSSLASNTWAILSLVFLSATLGFSLLFMLSERGLWRRIGFFCALGFTVILIFCISFAASGKRELANPNEGIILSQAVSVKSSPNSSGSDIFIIHEGTKVSVISSFEGWCEIMIADGNKGWVPAGDMGLIN